MKISKENVIEKKHKKIVKIFKIHNGYARSKDILAEGIHPRDIKSILDKGIIIKVKNGLYRLSDTPVISNQSFIDLACAVPDEGSPKTSPPIMLVIRPLLPLLISSWQSHLESYFPENCVA
jgi:hypothetical protein